VQKIAVGLVVDVPAHELGKAGCEMFAHILRFNVAIRAGTIGDAAMSFEGRLLLRRGLGSQDSPRFIHVDGPIVPPLPITPSFAASFAPQVRLGFTKGNLGFLIYDCQFNQAIRFSKVTLSTPLGPPSR